MTHKIDPDEAAELVEEAAAIIREHNGNPPDGFWEETQRRILAAVRPKGPWPMMLGDNEILGPDKDGVLMMKCHQVDELHHDGCRDKDCPINGSPAPHPTSWNGVSGAPSKEVDRFIVAWLQHRGVDLGWVSRDIKDGASAQALRAILDNAEAQ